MAEPGREGAITGLLIEWSQGSHEALRVLMPLVYRELRRSAQARLLRERSGNFLQPTELVNEVYLRLEQLKEVSWESRGRFYAFASRLMRQILVEHIRWKHALKRGGGAAEIPSDLLELPWEPATDPVTLLLVDEIITSLGETDSEMARIVEMRFFGGYEEEEVAAILGISRSKVQRNWRMAKALIARKIQEG